MRLAPDFNFDEHIISLQNPYTIDNELIFNVRLDNDVVKIRTIKHNDRLSVLVDNEYWFVMDRLNHTIKSIYETLSFDSFYDEQNRPVRIPSDFSVYYNCLLSQTTQCENREIVIENYQRLIAQRRLPQMGNCRSIDMEAEYREIVNCYRRFSAILPDSDSFNPSYFSREYNRFLDKEYIHPYNYKPKYIHYKLDIENSPLLLGAEIEVAGNIDKDEKDNREKVVKKCIQIMNGSDSDEEKLIYSTRDSTVQIELDTMPCSLEYHKTLNYKEMFSYLDKQGYKGHDADSAGLHIHADRKYLGKTELMQQLTISKILYILEKFNDEICVIARRNNSYSQFVGNGKDETGIVDLYGKYKNRGKRVALNLQHPETIEFRCFRSTLKYETFILTLEFVQDIIDYAKSINIEEIELIQWDDLMKTFSDELREYYVERLEKSKEKPNLEIYFKQVAPAGSFGIDITSTLGRNLDFNPDSFAGRFHEAYQNLVNSTISVELAEPEHEVNMTEDGIEKNIKKLKKQIKNSRNYLEKKSLQKKLTEYQKELKKLKKRQLNSMYGYQAQMS